MSPKDYLSRKLSGKITVWEENLGGGGLGLCQVRRASGRNDMKIAFYCIVEVFLPSKMGCDQDLD